ncbi:MAG: hypothetical protein LBE32_03300 [Burkholderiales bacterium]|jgi:hypothetical protein|nr:hypothetical protein [Burkholderiales bacterium]
MKRLFFSFAILTAVTGCAVTDPLEKPETTPSGDRGFVGAPVSVPSAVEPPRPKHNLSGFPLPYRQGYDDGCNSVQGTERKDAQRFVSDANYRTGWQDGYALCARRK